MAVLDVRFSSGRGVTVSMARLSTVLMVIMVLGFFACIGLALVYSFEKTTATHCEVPNYLPSISAAIAVPPSSYVWRFVIIMSAGLRLLLVSFHHSLYSSVSSKASYYKLLCDACAFFELVENLALVGLTCVSSRENFSVHENMFIVFQVCSMIFMILMCNLHRLAINSGVPPSPSEQKTLNRQYTYCIINICSFFIAIYFYFRHESYCEPGVYTLFAVFEYLVVLSNIAFHYIVTINFQEREVVVGARMHGKG